MPKSAVCPAPMNQGQLDPGIARRRRDPNYMHRRRQRLQADPRICAFLEPGANPVALPNPAIDPQPPFEVEDLDILAPRHAEVLRMRYGLLPGDETRYTLQEIGDHLEVGKERVRQMQNASLGKLGFGALPEAIYQPRWNEHKVSAVGAWASREDAAAIAYEAMAPAYDAFTAHHNYELWLGKFLPKFEANGLNGNRLLDAACGTGKSFMPMLKRGWNVTGSDLSPAMLSIARGKVGDRARLVQADLRDLPVFGEFDLVWALADAVNYLLEREEFVSALRGLARNLAPTGVLIFDTNTLYTYRTFFAEQEVVETEDSRMIWTGGTASDAPPGVLAAASFKVEPKEPGGLRIEPATHLERHYPKAEVLALLAEAGLKVLDIWGHHYDAIPRQPMDEGHDVKAIYIACLESPGQSGED